eukprot:TRINITY_DN3377_c0_g1_i2.p2 TRINITY_DN3377_c0_g1~~TRINITY_DN3377_c0_g1_i2.p2  ORF type:complete len:186 (-),score=35.48 TRINITY_DN3377_c0_g1_i2:135-692(-)
MDETNHQDPNLNNPEQEEGPIDQITSKISSYIQLYVDRYVIYPKARWVFAGVVFLIYVYRAYVNNGLHVISYFLGLYMLDKFLGFISPKNEEDVILPTRQNEEFKPFRRAVRELDLWKSYVAAFMVSIVLSYFQFLNIPVFWPLLVMYFIMVMVVAFRTKITHMIRYRYVPIDIGKRTYNKKSRK